MSPSVHFSGHGTASSPWPPTSCSRGPGAATRQECHQATGLRGQLRSPASACRPPGCLRGGAGCVGAGTACPLPPDCLPEHSHSAVLTQAVGPWSLGPQAIGDKGQTPWPWRWAIDPAPAGRVEVGRPWPGQTEAARSTCRPGTHLPLPKVSRALQDGGP